MIWCEYIKRIDDKHNVPNKQGVSRRLELGRDYGMYWERLAANEILHALQLIIARENTMKQDKQIETFLGLTLSNIPLGISWSVLQTLSSMKRLWHCRQDILIARESLFNE